MMQMTFVQKFQDPNLSAVEQGSLIWLEPHWFHDGQMLRWVQEEIARGRSAETYRSSYRFHS
jgi:hypothetical protein